MRLSPAGGAGTRLGLQLKGASPLQPRVTPPEGVSARFSQLISSGRARSRSVSSASWSASTAAHVLVLLLAAAAASRLATPTAEAFDRGEVTYLHIAQPQAPAPEAVQVAPEPPPPPQAPDPLPEPVEVTRPDIPAGFQELLPPREVKGIPDPSSASLVDAADFRGRGVVGGVAGGRPPLPSDTVRDAHAGAVGEAAPLLPEMLYVQPRILNLAELGPSMEDLYPEYLRAIGAEGRVVVEFVVGNNGRIEPESVKIIESKLPGFEKPTRELLALLRWAPGQHVQGQPVRSLIQMPVDWTINKKR